MKYTVRRTCDRGDEYVTSDTHFRYPKGTDDCGRHLSHNSASSNENIHVTVTHADFIRLKFNYFCELVLKDSFQVVGILLTKARGV